MLIFTLTSLLEMGSKGLDVKGHFVLDVKIGVASNYRVISGHKNFVLDVNSIILH